MLTASLTMTLSGVDPSHGINGTCIPDIPSVPDTLYTFSCSTILHSFRLGFGPCYCSCMDGARRLCGSTNNTPGRVILNQGHEGTYRIHPAATYYVTVLVRKLCMFFEITKALLFKVGRARMIASFGSARVHIYSCSHTGSLSKRWFWKWSEPCILYHLLLA